VVFQYRPYLFDGVILAVISGIISQTDIYLVVEGKFNQSLHKLTSVVVIFRPILGFINDGIGIKPGFSVGPKIL